MTAHQPPRVPEILLVEDSQSDVELTQELLEEAGVPHRLRVARDGEAALAELRCPATPRPDLVLLDLNLPRVDGREVLRAVKGDDELKTIPIIVLSTSREASDVLDCYREHANCFISKPLNLDEFLDIVQAIERFWLTVARLPPS